MQSFMAQGLSHGVGRPHKDCVRASKAPFSTFGQCAAANEAIAPLRKGGARSRSEPDENKRARTQWFWNSRNLSHNLSEW